MIVFELLSSHFDCANIKHIRRLKTMKKILNGILICIIIISVAFILINPSSTAEKSKYDTYNYPPSYMIENNHNYFDYQPGYECSAFSSAYLLRHYGFEASGLDLYKNFPNKLSNGGGVYPSGIINFFNDRDFQVTFIKDASIDDLKQELSEGHPVIVYIHVYVVTDNVHCTHYVPLVGYDENNFYFAESLPYMSNYKDQNLPYNRKTDIKTFKKLWTNVEGLYNQPYFSIQDR